MDRRELGSCSHCAAKGEGDLDTRTCLLEVSPSTVGPLLDAELRILGRKQSGSRDYWRTSTYVPILNDNYFPTFANSLVRLDQSYTADIGPLSLHSKQRLELVELR